MEEIGGAQHPRLCKGSYFSSFWSRGGGIGKSARGRMTALVHGNKLSTLKQTAITLHSCLRRMLTAEAAIAGDQLNSDEAASTPQIESRSQWPQIMRVGFPSLGL